MFKKSYAYDVYRMVEGFTMLVGDGVITSYFWVSASDLHRQIKGDLPEGFFSSNLRRI